MHLNVVGSLQQQSQLGLFAGTVYAVCASLFYFTHNRTRGRLGVQGMVIYELWVTEHKKMEALSFVR